MWFVSVTRAQTGRVIREGRGNLRHELTCLLFTFASTHSLCNRRTPSITHRRSKKQLSNTLDLILALTGLLERESSKSLQWGPVDTRLRKQRVEKSTGSSVQPAQLQCS